MLLECIIVVVFRQLYREIMKKVNLFYLFIPLFVSTISVSANPPVYPANTKMQTPIWPNSVMPYAYQWPMQAAMMPTNRSPQGTPVFPPNYAYPMYRGATPYNAMRYPQNYPAMAPRFPVTQAFPQTQAIYPANLNIPMMNAPAQMRQGQQYVYPMQYPSNGKNTPQLQAPHKPRVMQQTPYRKPMPNQALLKKKQKPWGDTRYIWPDFYTDATGDMWDNMMNAPYDIGRMPGGWRFPSLSSPDPVTVGDAVTNQFPPIMDEVPNFMPFMN